MGYNIHPEAPSKTSQIRKKKGGSSTTCCNGRGCEVEQNVSLWKPGKCSLYLTAKITVGLLFCKRTPCSLFTSAADYRTQVRMWCWFWNGNASPCFLLEDQFSFYYRIIVIPACRFVLFTRQSWSHIFKKLTIYLGILTSMQALFRIQTWQSVAFQINNHTISINHFSGRS